MNAAQIDAMNSVESLAAELAAERKERLRIQEELALRDAALDAATTHMLIIDIRHGDDPIVYANRTVALAHGFSDPSAMIGIDARSLARDRFTAADRERLLREIEESGSARMELAIPRRDGSEFIVGFTTTPLRGADGKLTHILSVGADITARREYERQQEQLQQELLEQMRQRERMAIELRLAQKLESIGRLAAGLAHEINTPIQYVTDSVHFLRTSFEDLLSIYDVARDLLRRAAGSSEFEQAWHALEEREAQWDLEFMRSEIPRAFERTLEGAARVANIVRAMKEYAYPDAVEQRAADLNHALETTLTVARNEYRYAAAVQTELGPLPPVVCNVGELNQVFLNLIVNAAHAIADAGRDASSGLIRITTGLAGEAAFIEIADNGCGIPAENLERIFDPFFTTKEVGRGTGQGLSIARSIVVDKHAGHIDVTSVPGKGTCFRIRVPVRGRAGSSS
ncbi:sensor histidine kinase [Steroidobacter flavus]|uniref:histidine kinase n=1 Tax=Steroidobacter flavus TaxID=1842136 RepID=A0ABV8SQ12_9GAMM